MWAEADPLFSLRPLFSLLAVIFAGWFWGSFLNQVVDRTPYRSPPPPLPNAGAGASGAEPPAAPRELTLLRPARSLCLTCGARLSWHDNIPVVSYLWLGGRCRFCGVAIGRRTLLMEVATPPILALWHQGASLTSLAPTPYLLGFAVLSWLIVALPLVLERRRFTTGFLAAGALVVGGLVTGALLRVP